MAVDRGAIAAALAAWLRSKPGVRDVQAPNLATRRPASRIPIPFPLPSFLNIGGGPAPSFELRFTFKEQPRTFRYFIEQQDDQETIINVLRVHTNGDLLVRVPDEYGHIVPNDIYYSNRSSAGAAYGSAAPRR